MRNCTVCYNHRTTTTKVPFQLFSLRRCFFGGEFRLSCAVHTALKRNGHYDALLALRFFPATFRKHSDACFPPFPGLFIMLPSSGCRHAAIEQRLLDPSSSFNHDSQFLCPDRPSQVDNVPIVVGADRLQSDCFVTDRTRAIRQKKITSIAEAEKVGVVSSPFLFQNSISTSDSAAEKGPFATGDRIWREKKIEPLCMHTVDSHISASVGGGDAATYSPFPLENSLFRI